VTTLHAALPLSALLAAAYLFFTSGSRLLPLVSGAGAGLELALAQGWIRLALPSHTLGLALGGAIAAPALVLWWRAGGKGPLTGASVVAFIGLLQVALAALPRLL
jgi:hypothetical protein